MKLSARGLRPVQSMATLNDIAQKCSLSVTTVSVILTRKHAQYNIAPETVERVLAAARELDYTPNLTARGLKLKRTHTLGVGIYDLTYITSGPFALMFAGAAYRAAEDDYRLELCTTDPKDREGSKRRLHFLDKARRAAFDGLLVHDQIVPDEDLIAAADLGLPVVMIERQSPIHEHIAALYVDYDTVVADLTEELVRRGYSEVALVSSLPGADRTQRIERGYHSGLQRAGQAGRERILWTDEISFLHVSELIESYVSSMDHRQPAALICWDEDVARYTMRTLRQLGKTVPESYGVFSLVGCPADAECLAISSLDTRAAEIGSRAVAKALEAITGTAQPSDETLRPEFLFRESTL